jgi:hypothetical protein
MLLKEPQLEKVQAHEGCWAVWAVWAYVCSYLIAGIVGSNFAKGMNFRLLDLLCVAAVSGHLNKLITRPEKSYRLCG